MSNDESFADLRDGRGVQFMSRDEFEAAAARGDPPMRVIIIDAPEGPDGDLPPDEIRPAD